MDDRRIIFSSLICLGWMLSLTASMKQDKNTYAGWQIIICNNNVLIKCAIGKQSLKRYCSRFSTNSKDIISCFSRRINA